MHFASYKHTNNLENVYVFLQNTDNLWQNKPLSTRGMVIFMKNFRLWLIGFVIVIAIFFNIELLTLAKKNVIDIGSFVYILGLGAIILTFTLSPIHPVNLFLEY